MLAIFRRHTGTCTAANGGVVRPRDYRRCDCPMHTEGRLNGVMMRKALDTTSWTVAQGKVREKEARGAWDDPQATKRVSIKEAVETFLVGACNVSNGKARSTNRNLTAALHSVSAEYKALAKTRTFSPALLEFTAELGLVCLDQVTLPVLTKYIERMACSANYLTKRIRTLRRFFYFCINAGWANPIPSIGNPALALEKPKGKAVAVKAKQPYTDGEVEAVISTAREMYGDRLAALVYTMRYAGLRISDAATLNVSAIQGDMIVLDAMRKTGDPLALPMHPDMKRALAAIEPNEAGYYFWSGTSEVMTATDNNRARLVKVFERLGMVGAHPHRFRHTFAVDLLVRGVAIDLVSKALGHSSIKITEKHYAPFVAARRAQLAAAMRLAWGTGNTPTPTPAPSNVVPINVGVAA